jgi:hypothetical protein
MVSRDVVEEALKNWLLALGKSQKVKTKDTVHRPAECMWQSKHSWAGLWEKRSTDPPSHGKGRRTRP